MSDNEQPNEGNEKMRGPGRPRVTETPEFADAVNSAVEERLGALLPELLSRFSKAQEQAGPAPREPGQKAEDGNFVQALALQLAELTGQGQGRIYVSPEVIDQRRRAHERMVDLLLDMRAQRITPSYRLKNKVFLNLGPKMGEVLIDPMYRDNNKIIQAQEIDWPGVPNLSMEPINDAAEQVFAAFCESTGGTGKSAAPDRLWALTGDGAILRGNMQEILGRGELAGGAADDALPAAGIRRHDKPPTQKVQVLGSLTPAVEVS